MLLIILPIFLISAETAQQLVGLELEGELEFGISVLALPLSLVPHSSLHSSGSSHCGKRHLLTYKICFPFDDCVSFLVLS